MQCNIDLRHNNDDHNGDYQDDHNDCNDDANSNAHDWSWGGVYGEAIREN